MAIIIVEGVDRVGKTTLCEKLEDELGYKRFRDDFRYYGNYKQKSINTEKINTLMNLIEGGFIDNIILDRFHLTEYVYGDIERGYENKDMLDIDTRLSKLDNVLLVYISPTDVEKSSEQHGKDLRRHERGMQRFLNKSKLQKINISYNDMDVAIEMIKTWRIGR